MDYNQWTGGYYPEVGESSSQASNAFFPTSAFIQHASDEVSRPNILNFFCIQQSNHSA